MAPLCVAGRLPLLPFPCIVLFLSFLFHKVSSLLVYDRLILLKICDSENKLPIQDFNDQTKPPPPVLAFVPSHLWRLPGRLPRNSRRRRRGKRGGVICRLKAHLAWLFGLSSDYAGCDIRGSVDYSYRWLLPAIPEAVYPPPCRRPVRIRRWGRTLESLRPVNRASQQTDWHFVRMRFGPTPRPSWGTKATPFLREPWGTRRVVGWLQSAYRSSHGVRRGILILGRQ